MEARFDSNTESFKWWISLLEREKQHHLDKHGYEGTKIVQHHIEGMYLGRHPKIYVPPRLTPNGYIPGQKLGTGEYLVVRKDGKTHLEKYNGTGWAYNDKVIAYFYTPKISR